MERLESGEESGGSAGRGEGRGGRGDEKRAASRAAPARRRRTVASLEDEVPRLWAAIRAGAAKGVAEDAARLIKVDCEDSPEDKLDDEPLDALAQGQDDLGLDSPPQRYTRTGRVASSSAGIALRRPRGRPT